MKKVTPITILSDGDIFGEIGMLTNLRRTCSVVTQDTCVFQTLSSESMQEIKEMFPSIFERIYGNMFSYNDEDMTRRRQFVENIPYLRGLDPESITEIAYLMRQLIFEEGDLVLGKGQINQNILILWEGTIQVRVTKKDVETEEVSDYWLDNLEKGTCFSVYNCFDRRRSQIVDFYASSQTCVIQSININELENLAQNIIALNDRLKHVKLRIQSNMVDDIDYFTFPTQMLEQNIQNKTDDDFRQYRKKMAKAKEIMTKQILRFVELHKEKKADFPKAIDLLMEIRKGRQIDKENWDKLYEESY